MTIRSFSNLRSAHVSFAGDGEVLQAQGGLLAGVRFSTSGGTAALSPGALVAQVPMTALDASGVAGTALEMWHADGVLTPGSRGALRYCHNEQILFGVIQLAETDFDDQNGKTPLQQAAEQAYREIFKLTDVLGFDSILRFWNYFADINGQTHGVERYRQFNMGRQDGFLGGGRAVTGSVPAASALGFAQGPLTVYFLAARGVAPIAIENPRQLSAYRYPDDYGPRSPTFSRAAVVRLESRDLLFLSGTASIVGHRTLHPGDVLAQTRETVANITQILEQANRAAPQARFSLGDLHYKVYVRHARDAAAIHAELRRSLGQAARMTFLHADICRQDLLMEIEATAGHPMT